MIFNRPETTTRVFEAIRKAQPKQLFVAADGPRAARPGEREKCAEARYIATQIDWDCEVKTLFRDVNLGCGVAPAQNITWFFEQVERGIILEDDCLPDPTFFSFCETMLDYYIDDLRIGQIAGYNCQHGKLRGNSSYYFSKYFHIWGWATWRNRWDAYSFELAQAKEIIDNTVIEKKCKTNAERAFWHRKLKMLEGGKRSDIWDYQWMFANWYLDRLSIVPNVNLVSNIGFIANATHTTSDNPKVANLPTEPIVAIHHPNVIYENRLADQYAFFHSGVFAHPSFKDKLRWTIKKMIPKQAKSFFLKGYNP